MAPVVELRRVSLRFGDRIFLRDFGLTVEQGQFIALLGPDGAGKSTLLRLVAGQVAPTSGQVLLEGRDVAGLPPEQRSVGMVSGSGVLPPHLTVAENVAFDLQVRRTPASEIPGRVAEALALVGVSGREWSKPAELTAAEQLRAALARAIVTRPSVLLLDEPLVGLDVRQMREMQSVLKRIHRETGSTILLATQNVEAALGLANYLVVLNNGRQEQAGMTRDVFQRPTSQFVADYLGFENFLMLPDIGLATIRPEYVAILPPGARVVPTGYVLDGRVLTATFRGTETSLVIETDLGQVNALVPGSGWDDGDEATVFLARDRMVALEE